MCVLCKGFLTRVWACSVQSSELCLLAKRLQICLVLYQCLGCDTAFSMFPIWIISWSDVIRKAGLAVANIAGERCKRREGIWYLCFSDHQSEKKELQAYVQIKYMNTRKIMEARKSSLYLGKCGLSLNSYVVCVGKTNVFDCIIYSFAYLKSFVVFTLS